ncbi:hypothetical protein [Candidatus Electronema sp. JM]|uniref:hypothetical protein n=1 Tax=Candidatus Electronema sp. JM TaxID=3401571 RepID=UPI003AA86E33
MLYSDFTLQRVKKELHLELIEEKGLFAHIEPVPPSELLTKNLEDNVPLALAINTEKARSELIIATVLVELKRLFKKEVSFFSGIEFNVDKEKGLAGFCDFILSASAEQLVLAASVIAVVEAKNENIIGGLGQCIAEMAAAQLFNQQENNVLKTIYGVVTSGNVWRFLKMAQQNVQIDLQDYYIENVSRILGILSAMVRQTA